MADVTRSVCPRSLQAVTSVPEDPDSVSSGDQYSTINFGNPEAKSNSTITTTSGLAETFDMIVSTGGASWTAQGAIRSAPEPVYNGIDLQLRLLASILHTPPSSQEPGPRPDDR
ncbi:hypothetical protein PENPOL_c020G03981 [Penicillium polonicum]|uniref:Uncharacterized protein n=1 Tax=Penicillium polonicum TaxID=60169 RepID=A0A1V6N815_PENPO|nr:hypothetical protein PENPOL_c020G03981 [Penicillium polonicum]